MIDRSKALVAGVALALGALLLVSVGFVAGRATNEDDTASTQPAPRTGDGLPAGPADVDDGVPVGFARSEEGARGAAIAWLPWFLSSPASERPDGLEQVLADGVDDPSSEALTARFQFAPIAVKVDMDSDTRATATLVGPILEGNLGDELTGEFWRVPVTLEWDDGASDWRISSLPTATAANYAIQGELTAGDVEGFEAIRTAGSVAGSPIVEAVPGD